MIKTLFFILVTGSGAVLSAFFLDMVTAILGKSSRGVSYGISIYYMWCAITAIITMMLFTSHSMKIFWVMTITAVLNALLVFSVSPYPSVLTKMVVSIGLCILVFAVLKFYTVFRLKLTK
ncbi:MAG: hypothetical protein KUG69_11250 [Marinosulfonomonas sp.]|nr:hypothetical protein [Marinosulfonomonas sp.]